MSEALLDAVGVTKRFAGICALDNVDLRVDRGELVGLIGPNGAGKTTLFNCISGVSLPDGGAVRFDGHDITRAAVHRRARAGIGRTFQRLELFTGLTVREHLQVAARSHRGGLGLLGDLVLRPPTTAAQRAQIDELLTLLGLRSVADRPVEALSLGVGRLVELARALVTEPTLLLLDEPSSGLDSNETAEVAEVLQAVQRERGTAILLVEHDIVTVTRLATRLYVLDHGTLLAHGPTDEVMADERVRAAYLGAGA